MVELEVFRHQLRRLIAAAVLAGSAAPLAFANTPSLVQQHVATRGVSIAVPAGWQTTSPASFGGVTLDLLSLAPVATAGFRANINLIVEPLPPGESLRAFMFSGASAAYKYAGTLEPVTIGGIAGLEYRSTKAFKAGTRPLLTKEYAFVRNRQVFIFTYTALASTRTRFEPLFNASVQTIRFSASSGTA
jgi:hypothetical protein